MFELEGKYNLAKVFTDNADSATIGQLYGILNQESAKDSRIRIMPDCHAGKGCVIGTTMTIKDKVIPNLVGVDIGCGMLTIELLEDSIDLPKLDSIIRKEVPCGFSIHDRAITQHFSKLDELIAPIDVDRAMRSLGSLGGGNHFIEVDRDENTGKLYLVIHTGSRHLGTEVCKYHQEVAVFRIENAAKQSKTNEIISRLKAEGREKDIEGAIKALKTQKNAIPKELCYLESQDLNDYLHDMQIAQEYAKINREQIAKIIMKKMKLHESNRFHTIHNYIDTEAMILRKGAISAKDGETVLIPMNMRDGSLLCVGKGNADWNYSAPHGAGRLMSRGAAKESLSMKDFNDSMKGIYTTCVLSSTIDESPMVYKPMEEIVQHISETVEIKGVIKPIYNFKAS